MLLLRAAIIALLAFALARPTVQFGGSLGSQEAPVAAAIVFDTAPHIDYRHENQTRLDAAKKLGTWLLSQLPGESEIAVLDTRLGGGAFQVDRGAAKQRIERLEVVPNSQPLVSVIDEAVRLLKESRKERKELYIFTDLSRGSWPASRAAQLRDRLAALPGVGIYVIDVGVKDPIDYALGEIRLSGEVLSNRGSLTIAADLSALGGIGRAGRRTVSARCRRQAANRRHRKRRPSRPAKRGRSSSARNRSRLGVHQGYLRTRRPRRLGGRRHAIFHRRSEARLADSAGRAAAGREITPIYVSDALVAAGISQARASPIRLRYRPASMNLRRKTSPITRPFASWIPRRWNRPFGKC